MVLAALRPAGLQCGLHRGRGGRVGHDEVLVWRTDAGHRERENSRRAGAGRRGRGDAHTERHLAQHTQAGQETLDLHLCLPPLRQSGFLRRRPVDVACCRRRQVAFFGGEASGQNGRHCCGRSRNRFCSAANSRHERRERVEIGTAGVSRERRLDRVVVDGSMFGHLRSVTVEEAHRVTPCRTKSWRGDSKPRRCSCLTAPGLLPSTSATWSTLSSPMMRSSTTDGTCRPDSSGRLC